MPGDWPGGDGSYPTMGNLNIIFADGFATILLAVAFFLPIALILNNLTRVLKIIQSIYN